MRTSPWPLFFRALATVLVGFEKVIEILRTYEFDFFAASSETESGRQMVLDGMTEDGDATREQATCCKYLTRCQMLDLGGSQI
jgi:hypothetical protein